MKIIRVGVKRSPYKIHVGPGSLNHLPALIEEEAVGSHAVVITTPNIAALHAAKLEAQLRKSRLTHSLLLVADSEKSKNSALALRLINRIAALGRKRDIFLIAFGGGVVGDLTGFIAAVYKRGIPYLQMPTTLLAQIDSSIGGKTAVDTAFGKNLIGVIYQPCLVLADTALLATLPKKELLSGLAEAVKYALIQDKKLFSFLEDRREEILRVEPQPVGHLVYTCAAIKARIVERDEFDQKGIRVILNFGHTLGHALEAASGFRIAHGEAVAIGMVFSAVLSRRLKLLAENDLALITSLIEKIGLPVRAGGVDPGGVLEAMGYDKKFRAGVNRFVLLQGIGRATVVENIPQKLIRDILTKDILVS